MAKKGLSMESKVIYLLIKRELESTGKDFTASMTDNRLAKMTCVSPATVQRILKKLVAAGLIAVISQTKVEKKDSGGNALGYRGIRYIYLDKKKAGYRLRAISKAKVPMEFWFRFHVVQGMMSPEAYLAWRKEMRIADEERKERERAHEWRLELEELLGDASDEGVAGLELADKVPPGTYFELREKCVERAARLKDDGSKAWDADFPSGDVEGKPGA